VVRETLSARPGGLPSSLRFRSRRLLALATELRPWVWPLGAWVVAYDALRLARADLVASRSQLHSTLTTEDALRLVMAWIARAQDAAASGGVPAYYSLVGGWGPEYPETTGYQITTWLDHAVFAAAPESRARALRAGEWLLRLQSREGWFPAGFARAGDGPSVFNTGQILDGLVSLSVAGEARFHEAALRAGSWLLSVQDDDGVWRRHCYEETPHVYYSMVAGSLAALARLTGDVRFLDAALRKAASVLRSQSADGWIEGLHLGRRPNFLHFIAYTLQGLLRVGAEARRDDLIAAAARAAAALRDHFDANYRLPGAFTAGWRSSARFVCLTGNAQTAIVWFQLYRHLGDARWRDAACRLNQIVKAGLWQHGPSGLKGAVKGSDPVWGPYLRLRYPNWAAKFSADAFMLELRSRD
jgi:hypothetical protein